MSYKSSPVAQQEAKAAKSLGDQHSIIKMLGQVLEIWECNFAEQYLKKGNAQETLIASS